ncbi:MAG: hypothetical protein OHK0038_08670 [Flammeovirgaceae bacterium]
MVKQLYFIIAIFFLIVSCQQSSQTQNPHAEGFDIANSDAKAIALADEVMAAMGGRENWDKTRFISWVFFGKRKIFWDKWSGDVKVKALDKDLQIIVNLNTGGGRVWKDSTELSHPDSLAKYLELGKKIWVNDSYWLIMPYKLKDSGVRLKYLKEDKNKDGNDSDVIELTFKQVGYTPNNKYNVWIDKKTKLVNQWAFYEEANDTTALFIDTWKDYQKFGNILLSASRGDNQLTEIEVLDKAPDDWFTFSK